MRFLDVLKSRLSVEEKEIECPVYNPLNLGFTSLVEVTDFFSAPFAFSALACKEHRPIAFEEYTREIFGSTVVFTDYVFKDDFVFKLRVLDDKVFLLWHFDQFGYSEDFYNILCESEKSKLFNITEDDGSVQAYTRLNGMDCAWAVSVRKLIDADGNGKITKSDPVEKINLKYWDFYKAAEEHSFLFIELNECTGLFTLWNGLELTPNMLNIL